jgi:4-aminobutyrate aminotransferase
MDVIRDDALVENAASMGAVLREGLEALKTRTTAIGDVRGRGLMLGIELVRDEKGGDHTPAADTTLAVLEETKERGLLIGRGGLHGNVLRVAPPLVVSKRDVDDALKILEESFAALGG